MAEALDDPDRMAAAVLSVSRGFFSRMGRTDLQLVAAIERAIAARRPGDDTVTAELLATLASELVWAEDGDRRFALSDQALATARQIGEPKTLARVLLLRTMATSAPDTLADRIAECDELLNLAEDLQDPAIRLQAAFNRGGTALESGDIAAANEMVERTRDLACDLRQPSVVWLSNMMGTSRRILEGALADAEHAALETLDLGGQANKEAEARIFFTEQMLEIRRWQGRLEEMLPEFQDLAGIDSIDFGYALVRYLHDAGEEQAATSCYESIMQRLRLPPRRDLLAGAILNNLAYLTARVGDGERASSIYEELLPFGDAFPTTTVAKPAGWHHLGMLAATMGRSELAEDHFSLAVTLHEKARAPLLVAETKLEWARLLVGRGADLDRAAGLLDAVRSTATASGARFLERSCLDLSPA
jgi:tetratricopeptide (TPR) repeat protein